MLILTVLASECVLYPDGEEEPLLLPPIGGPGIPGILGTVFDDLASYIYTHTHRNTSLTYYKHKSINTNTKKMCTCFEAHTAENVITIILI